MRMTKERLKKIIKEELENLAEEQKDQQAVEKAMDLKDSPKTQRIFDKMERDPEVQKAVQQLLAKMPMSEQFSNQQPMDDSGAAPGRMAGALAGASMANPMALPVLLKSTAAGKALMSALVPILGASGATLAAGAGAFLLPIAIGYLIDRELNK